jgi:hypothetical protein
MASVSIKAGDYSGVLKLSVLTRYVQILKSLAKIAILIQMHNLVLPAGLLPVCMVSYE